MKHVLMVDDLPEALAMMGAAVREAFPMAHCTSARSAAQARAALSQATYDLALIDLELGDGKGHDLIVQIAQQQPPCAIVVASIYDDDDNLFQALQAGAQGYLLKDQSPDWLARQLRGFADGQPPLSPAIARRLLRHFQPLQATSQKSAAAVPVAASLSPREREVLGLLAQGIQIAEIAATLGISRHTVGDHVKHLYRKLNISSRAEAALQARGMGLI